MPNIIGEPLENYVVKQILNRQELHGKGTTGDINVTSVRTPETISILNSNTSWIKLASGVKVDKTRLNQINVPTSLAGSGLAKKYVLFSGISKYTNLEGNGKLTQRDGFNPTYSDDANSSYSYGSYGYSPMPGIISADIKALNRGSIKKATVKLKAHNKQQFDIIDYLYLRLGYTVLLEWGNSVYVSKSETGQIVRKDVGNTLIEDKFFNSDNTSHLKYADYIESYRNKYEGNYDGLLCKVSNFSWTFNDDGSYDIDLTLISLGDIVESLKANVPVDKGTTKFIIENLSNPNSSDVDNIDKNAKSNSITSMLWLWRYFNTGGYNPTTQKIYIYAGNSDRWIGKFLDNGGDLLSSVPYTWNFYKEVDYPSTSINQDIRTSISPNTKTYSSTLSASEIIDAVKVDVDTTAALNINAPLGNSLQISDTEVSSTMYESDGTVKSIIAEGSTTSTSADVINPIGDASSTDAFQLFTEEKQYYLRFGYLLQYLSNYCIPKVKKDNASLFNISFDRWNSFMLFQTNQISLDPRVCIVRNDEFKKYNPDGNYKATAKIGHPDPGTRSGLEKWTPDSKKFAYPLNIYLNFNFIIDSLSSASDERGDINVFSFLSNICNGLNKALGGVNNLEPVINERTNTLYIIDSALTSLGKKSTNYSLKILGYKQQGNFYESNFIRKIDLRTAITPEYATMVTIGATAGGYVKGTEGTAFSKWNAGLTDRFKNEIIPANKSSENNNTSGSIDEALSNYYKELSDKITECYGLKGDLNNASTTSTTNLKIEENIINKNLSVGTEYLKYNLNKNKKSSVGFIPFKLGLKMDGLSGIKIYNKLNIDTSYLPSNYGDTLDFIVTGVNHTLSGNDWETEILTMAVPGTQENEDIIFTQDTDPNLPPGNPSTSSTTLGANNDAKKITLKEFKQLIINNSSIKSLGLAPGAICALIGHMSQETSTYDPTKLGDNVINPTQENVSSKAIGIGQWYPTPSLRRERLEKFAKDRSWDYLDINTQIEYITHELNQPFYQNSLMKILKDTTTSIFTKTVAVHLAWGFYPSKFYGDKGINIIKNIKTVDDWKRVYIKEGGIEPDRLEKRSIAAEDCYKGKF